MNLMRMRNEMMVNMIMMNVMKNMMMIMRENGKVASVARNNITYLDLRFQVI